LEQLPYPIFFFKKIKSCRKQPLSSPTSCRKQPVQSILERTISSRVSAIFAKLGGMQPLMSLLATTNTETGEFPRLSGRVDWNLLLFMERASSFRSKSCGGILPSNSLNLTSRHLRECKKKTTTGNGPLKWLLVCY